MNERDSKYTSDFVSFSFIQSKCHSLIYKTDEDFQDSEAEDVAHLNGREKDFDKEGKDSDEVDSLENKYQ